eukprot:Filipodium_phascolosomae@DN1670_c0_g1_i1.p2
MKVGDSTEDDCGENITQSRASLSSSSGSSVLSADDDLTSYTQNEKMLRLREKLLAMNTVSGPSQNRRFDRYIMILVEDLFDTQIQMAQLLGELQIPQISANSRQNLVTTILELKKSATEVLFGTESLPNNLPAKIFSNPVDFLDPAALFSEIPEMFICLQLVQIEKGRKILRKLLPCLIDSLQ